MSYSVLNPVVGKFSDLISQEANLLLGVDEQVILLRNKLEWMLMFIQDVGIKRLYDPRLKPWVSQVRQIAFRVEDVIDEFMFKIDHHRRSQRNSIWFIRYLKVCVFRAYHIPFLHELGSQIQVINTMAEKISDNKSEYLFGSIGQSSNSITSSNNEVIKSSRNIRSSDSYLDEESDVVGLEIDMKKVTSLLIGEEQRRVIVSIVGMGGVGKTTLAKKVYNNGDVKGHFDCFAWVSVSKDYRTKELLQGIMKCLTAKEKFETAEEDQLRKTLREYLQDSCKKYLIVLDDIWDIEAWNVLSSAFPDQDNGSRVLITTRIKEIALRADRYSKNVYELRPLDVDKSWDLFLKKIFPAGTTCPKELEDLGKEIVGCCGGLPLAIVVLGGVLSTKDQTPIAWSKVKDSVDWHLSHSGGSDSCIGILALSYYDLPDYLQPMFLYVGIFPEDHKISATKLIQYCVAEGFIRKRGNETLEDIAEDYLEMLIDKSMIQVTKSSPDGRPQYCQIHDLLRDLSIREAEDDKFLHQLRNIDFSSSSNDVRQVTIHDNDLIRLEEIFISPNPSVQHLRSMICFSSSIREQHLRCFVKGTVKLLRVLELRRTSLDKLPKEIGQLVHLKYLGLRNTFIETLPRSIGRLVNLQTLDLRYNHRLRCIPNMFRTLHQLRHLYIHKKFGFSMTLGVHNLTNLQTLIIPVGDWINTGGGLGQLRMLRKLVLRGSLVPYKKVISDSIIKLDGLRSLQLIFSEKIPKLTSFSSFTYLYKLYFHGHLEKLEFFPPNLNKLALSDSMLESDPMVILQQLPNLKVLNLFSAFTGKKMICSDGWFPRLKHLEICLFTNLEEWIVEKGALSSLRHLVIGNCPQLKMIPDGLREVTTLQTLILEDFSDEFKSRVRKNEGEDWYKIQHIPSVQIDSMRGI